MRVSLVLCSIVLLVACSDAIARLRLRWPARVGLTVCLPLAAAGFALAVYAVLARQDGLMIGLATVARSLSMAAVLVDGEYCSVSVRLLVSIILRKRGPQRREHTYFTVGRVAALLATGLHMAAGLFVLTISSQW